jgi:hypothetical protein
MSWNGPGYIVKIDETLDSQLYVQILKEDLKMSIKKWGFTKKQFIFQHDNDLKHTAKITKIYIESINITEAKG